MEKFKKWRSALLNKPTKLPLEDNEGQQSPGLAPFQYSPLDASTHIRVLEVLPGNPNSEIRFRLREKGLGDGDIYYALSYAWGPPMFTHKIYSAEGFIQVTENLWEALSRYRKADGLITLWVDAVCIDQANIQERSHQISLMRRIYSESKRILIWLGLESPSDRSAFEFITRIIDLILEKGDFSKAAMSNELIPRLNDEYQDAMTELFAKSWFSRVWTFQEIICAVEATLTTGSLDIDFLYLHSFSWILVLIGPFWLKSSAAQRAVMQLSVLRVTKDYLSQQSAVNSLFKLVKRTRTRLATDPRDMIYGLVALASDTNPLPFAPTYEIAVNHLYEEFAAHVIRQNKNLDIFGCCTFQPGLRECASWVPDWRYSEEFATFINPEKDSFHAAGTSCWDTSTAIVNHSLGVEAICLDRLQNITFPEPMPKPLGLLDWESYEPSFKWQQSMIRDTVDMASLSLLYKSEQERWHAWWRTFIGERNPENERADPAYERFIRSYTEIINRLVDHGPKMKPQGQNLDEFTQIYYCARDISFQRRFCLSLEGRIGWVPLAARTGDIVSLMRGSPVPVLIRPSQQGNSFFMIGQCYIHGIMDGEAVIGKEDQFRRIQLV